VRVFSLVAAVGLLLAPLGVLAQEEQPIETTEPAEQPAGPVVPAGPMLTSADLAPSVCTAGPSVLRFLEVRGSGFEPWALQRLNGALLDGAGAAQITWSSVWVSPQGQLTLEINLCADPFRGRPALGPGSYTVAIGPESGAIAATTIELSAPAEPTDEAAMPAAEAAGPTDAATPVAQVGANGSDTSSGEATGQAGQPAAEASPVPSGANNDQPAATPTPTPLPALSLPALAAPTPTPGPRTGLGSRQQPFPLGAPGTLADGWQLLVSGVSPDAFEGIQKEFPSARAPAADQRSFIVRVEATYRGERTGVFSASRLGLLAANGESYTQLDDACGLVPDILPPNLVVPGGQVRGNVCFTVRASDVDGLVLFDTAGRDNERPFFNLH
jgi:hypothetical protein